MPFDFYVNWCIRCAYHSIFIQTENPAGWCLVECLSLSLWLKFSFGRVFHTKKVKGTHFRFMHARESVKKNGMAFKSKRIIFAYKSTKHENRCAIVACAQCHIVIFLSLYFKRLLNSNNNNNNKNVIFFAFHRSFSRSYCNFVSI